MGQVQGAVTLAELEAAEAIRAEALEAVVVGVLRVVAAVMEVAEAMPQTAAIANGVVATNTDLSSAIADRAHHCQVAISGVTTTLRRMENQPLAVMRNNVQNAKLASSRTVLVFVKITQRHRAIVLDVTRHVRRVKKMVRVQRTANLAKDAQRCTTSSAAVG